MTFHVSLIWALGGLLASGLAGCVLKRGGYGLIADIGLGLGGSLVGSLILRALGISPEAGLFAMVVEALKAQRLKEIRLELAYIPSPYHEETVKFVVSIGGQ